MKLLTVLLPLSLFITSSLFAQEEITKTSSDANWNHHGIGAGLYPEHTLSASH